MNLIKYINEIKHRLFYIILHFILNFSIIYFYCDELIFFLIKNVMLIFTLLKNENISFMFTNINEALFAYFQVSYYVSLLISTPFILIQILLFNSPCLFQYENKKKFILFFISLIVLICIFLFTYKFFVPFVLFILLKIETALGSVLFNTQLETKLTEYLVLMGNLILMNNFIILVTLFIYTLLLNRVIPFSFFIKNRNYFIIIQTLIFSTIVPLDIIFQFFFLFINCFIYEFIFFSILIYYKTFNLL